MKPIKLEILLEGKGVKKGFEDVGDASKKMEHDFRKALSAQSDLIKKLEKELAALEKQLNKTSSGGAKSKLEEQMQGAKKVVQEEKKALDELEGSVNKNASSSQTLRTQIRNLENDMAKMTEGTKEYSAALQKLGDLKDRQADISKQGQIFSDDNKNIRATADAIAGLSGAMSAGVGIASLFGKEGEDLAKIQRNLQAVMATTIGIQQVANTLNKDSYFSHIVLGGAKRKLAAAQAFLNTQLGIGAGLSKVLMASGIGLLIAGIGAAVIAYQRWNEKQKEANKLKKEFVDIEVDTAKAMASEKVKLNALLSVAGDHNKTLDIRNKAISKLKEIMPSYNGYINKEGELVGNSTAALKAYVEQLYKVERAKKLYAKLEEKETEVSALEASGSGKLSGWKNFKVGLFRTFGFDTLDKELAERAKAWVNKIYDAKGDIAKIKEEINVLLSDESVFKELFGGDNADKTKVSNLLGEQHLSALRKIEQQEIDLMEEGRDKRKRQAELDYQLLLDNIEKEKQERLKHLEELKKQGEKIAPDAKDKINAESSVQADNAKRIRDKSIDQINKEEAKKESEKLEQLRAMYQDYEEQRLAIARRYEKDRAEIENSRLIAGEKSSRLKQLQKEKEKELKAVTNAVLQENKLLDLYGGNGAEFIKNKIKEALPLFEDLSRATHTELNKAKEVIKDINLPSALREQLKQAGVDLAKLDLQLKKIKKSSTEAIDERKWQKVLDTVSKLSNSLGSLGNAMSGMGGVSGEIGDVLSELANSAENVMNIFKSGASPLDMISSGVQGAVQIYATLARQQEENVRKQKELNDAIKATQQASRMARIEKEAYQQTNLFGVENPYARAIAGAKQYGESMQALKKVGDDLKKGQTQVGTKEVISAKNVAALAGGGAAVGGGIGAVVGSVIPVIGTAVVGAIGAGVGALIGGMVGLFSKKAKKLEPVFKNITERYGQLFDPETYELNEKLKDDYATLDDETKKIVDNWEEIKKKAKEAEEQMRQNFKDLAGDIGDKLSDALIGAFRDGDIYKGMDEFKKHLGGIIGTILQKQAFEAAFRDIFENAEEAMKKSFEKGGDEKIDDDLEQILNAVAGRVDGFANRLSKIDEQMKSKGFDGVGGDTTRQAAAKGVQTVSQDTANKIEGQLAYVQMQSEKKAVAINNMSAALHNALAPLSRIAANTEYCKHLEKMQKDMESVSNNISSIQSQGINLKR